MSEEKEVRDNAWWEDDVMRGVKFTFKLLNYMLQERGQLYGIVLYFMDKLGEEKIEFTRDIIREVSKDKYILANPNEETQTLTIEVKKREDGDTQEE